MTAAIIYTYHRAQHIGHSTLTACSLHKQKSDLAVQPRSCLSGKIGFQVAEGAGFKYHFTELKLSPLSDFEKKHFKVFFNFYKLKLGKVGSKYIFLGIVFRLFPSPLIKYSVKRCQHVLLFTVY